MRRGEWCAEAVQLRKGLGVTIPNRKLGESELKPEQATKEVGLQVPNHEEKRRPKSEHGALKMEKL